MPSVSWAWKIATADAESKSYLITSIRQRLAFGFRRQPDDHQPYDVNQRDGCAGLGVAARMRADQLPLGQRAQRGKHAPGVVAEPLPRRPNSRREQLGQIKRQPAVKGRSACAH